MAKTKIDYSKGLIYKIVCKDLECKYIYVGSTTNFRQRKRFHKSSCNNEKSKIYNLKIYQIIRENGGWDNWEMIEIEKYPCNDGNELRARERFKYEELQANMNICVPNRSEKEWRNDNKEKLIKYKKEYRENNKEKIKEQMNIYRENNKEKFIQYEKNRKNKKERNEKHKEKAKQKIICLCGSNIRIYKIKRHERSNKHIKYMEQLNKTI